MGENPGATRTPRVARSLDRRAGERAPDREPFPSPPRRRSTTATPSPRARAFQTARGRRATWRFPLLSTSPRVTFTRDLYDRPTSAGDSLRETAGRTTRKKNSTKNPTGPLFTRAALPSSLPALARGARGGGGARSPRAPRTPTGLRVTRGCFSSARGTRRARCPRRWRRARRRPWRWSSGAARTC